MTVTINADYFGPGDGIYVIEHESGTSTLGFGVCLDRIDRYATNLNIPAPKVKAGTLKAYEAMKELESALQVRYDETGERAVADLSPQLNGLEGYRVEVVDVEGDRPRRFIVGKSTGWLPCHLEISRRNAHGGDPARREYHSVKRLERVR